MKQKKRNFTEEDVIYYSFLGAFLAAALAAAVFSVFDLTFPSIHCIMRSMIGLYCPGCGGSRALFCLLHGQIGKSLYYNPVVFYTVSVVLIYLVSQTVSRMTKGKVSGLRFQTYWCYVGAALLVGNFIWKNYYLIVKGIQLID